MQTMNRQRLLVAANSSEDPCCWFTRSSYRSTYSLSSPSNKNTAQVAVHQYTCDRACTPQPFMQPQKPSAHLSLPHPHFHSSVPTPPSPHLTESAIPAIKFGFMVWHSKSAIGLAPPPGQSQHVKHTKQHAQQLYNALLGAFLTCIIQ